MKAIFRLHVTTRVLCIPACLTVNLPVLIVDVKNTKLFTKCFIKVETNLLAQQGRYRYCNKS